jgi:predicted transcriptional regulator of viral defense system
MKNSKIYNYLQGYINTQQSEGRLCFSLNEVIEKYPEHSKFALKLSLNRLSGKKKVISVYKGFYLIIPPEYRQRKIIPPELFINQLFAYLDRPYHVGLLSAAALHGASHQQAMEYYVFISKPAIRPTNVEGLKINYVVKNSISTSGIEKRKTDAGYINISNPELTAIDLIAYQHRIGGFNRASTVLYELSESMSPAKLNEILNENIPFSVLQRLGYILEIVLHKKELAAVIKNYLSDKKIFRIPLKPGHKKKGFSVSDDWKVIQNSKIETDF